ncbi:hypothetical protein [Roseateles sp. YR242]|uniref:hypothetical protein n=1 Tax=Roseateles sp. YR242 TaxID=1855305 RepID=UPI000B857711|nr:hypothetical protein [Roseateles sp. YR242]
MTSPNPLAFVTQMRQQGGPGAYAMAEQVTYQCREALQALQRYTDPAYASLRASQRARNVGREGHAESLQAMSAQKIEARCRPFADDLESDQPKSDDSSAKAYQEAMQLLLDPSKDLATSLKALAEQGQLQSAAVVLRSRYRFRDDELNTPENRDLLARAMTLAAFNASTDQQNQSEDLRLMTSCLYSSVCDGSYASEVLERWPEGSPQRAKAQAVAEQFQRAFETGDYAAFVRKR